MKIKNIITGILILIILAPVLFATSIEIDMKESFSLGEEISFIYTIISESSQEIEYIVSVNCPNAPLPLLEIKTASLEANVPLTETYIYLIVKENIEPQTCEAGVGILSPEILESKSFIIETNPSFDFNVLTCKDTECNEQTKVFVKNSSIYLDYTSEVHEPITTATLVYPDRSIEQLTLPISIKAEQIGTYELEIIAFKEGYKSITKKVQFGVIEQEANILYTEPQDVEDKDGLGAYVLFVMIGVVLILIVFLFIRFFRILKKRKRKKGYKKSDLEKDLKKGLKKKEKIIKKKERRLLGKLFHRKKKSAFGKKQGLDKKIKQEKKILAREKVGVRKEFGGRLRKEGEMLKKKEERRIGGEKLGEIRRLLSHGRMQLSLGNKWGAKNTYRKIHGLYVSLKPEEKSRELYNHILIFQKRLGNKRKN